MGKDLFNPHLRKFSIRKLNTGVCSVLLSTLLLLGNAAQVDADETVLTAEEAAVLTEAAVPAASQPEKPAAAEYAVEPALPELDQGQAAAEAVAGKAEQSPEQAEAVRQEEKATAAPAETVTSQAAGEGEKEQQVQPAEPAVPVQPETQTGPAVSEKQAQVQAVPDAEQTALATASSQLKDALAKARFYEADKLEANKEALDSALKALQESSEALSNSALSAAELNALTTMLERRYLTVMNAITRTNSGLRDSRNGQAMAQGSDFRATDTEKPQIISITATGGAVAEGPGNRRIIVYREENFAVEVKMTDDSGKIKNFRFNPNPVGMNTPGDRTSDSFLTSTASNQRISFSIGSPLNQAGNATAEDPFIARIIGSVSSRTTATTPANTIRWTRYMYAYDDAGNYLGTLEDTGRRGNDLSVNDAAFQIVIYAQADKYEAALKADAPTTASFTSGRTANIGDAADFITNAAGTPELPKTGVSAGTETTYTWKNNGNLNLTAGQHTLTAVVTYPDGSQDEVSVPVEIVDKTKIANALNQDTQTKAGQDYADAGQAAQDTYNNAVAKLQELAQDATASQEAVDAALKAVADAELNLTKQAAINAVNRAADARIATINQTPDATEEEKAAALAQVEADKSQAAQTIQHAADSTAISGAKSAALTDIASRQSAASVKPAAKAEVEKARQAKVDAIENNSALTTEEKSAAKTQTQQEADKAVAAIDAAADTSSVTQAQNDGIAGIQAVSEVGLAKPAAKAAVDQALKEFLEFIEADPDLKKFYGNQSTFVENYSSHAEMEVEGVKEAIDAAESNSQVNALKNPQFLSVLKTAFHDKFEQRKMDQQIVIFETPSLTTEEQQKALKELEEVYKENVNSINRAQSRDEVIKAFNEGVKAMEEIKGESIFIPSLLPVFDQIVQEKLADIDNTNKYNWLTLEEKETFKQMIRETGERWKSDILAMLGMSEGGFDPYIKNGTEAINDHHYGKPTAKYNAKNVINRARWDKDAQLDSRTDLTAEEIQAAKDEAQREATAANTAIDNSASNADVSAAQTAGQDIIAAINPTATVKPTAKQSVEQARLDKEAELDGRSDLTSEERAAAKAQARQEADKAVAAIDAATDNTGVTTAQNKGTSAIQGISGQAQSKSKATADLSQRAAVQKALVGSKPDLTAEEKQAAYDLIDQALTQGQAAINQAQDNTGVSQSYDYGAAAIAAIQGQAIAKPVAKAEIEKARQAKETAIDARTDLTAEEKTAAKAEAQREADTAVAAIDAAADNTGVTTAQTDGQNIIAAINPTAVAKPAAKAEVEKARQAKETAIDARTDLTAEEKTAAKAEAQREADTANTAIDNSADNVGVSAAQTAGQAAITAINPTAVAKPAAKAEIEKARQAKESAIAARPDLTAEEKQSAKAEAQREADKAVAAIDAATDNTGVAAAQNKGTSAIQGISGQAQSKSKATADLSQRAAVQKALVGSKPDLTAEEKQAAYALIDQALTQGQAAINQAQDNTGVSQSYDDGAAAIAAIQGQAIAKPAAKAEVEKARQAKVDAIDARTDLTTEEKTAAKAEAQREADTANTAIDNSVDNSAVTAAQTAGQDTISAINPAAVAKPAAKAEVEKARQVKETAIEGRTDLTAEEKTVAKAEAQREADKANTAIDNSADNAAVSTAQTAGRDIISAINPAAVAKSAAKAEIDRALQAKETAIDARPDLTAEEKTAAKAQAWQEADKAVGAIDAATDNTGVTTAQNKGTSAIQGIFGQAQSKSKATADLSQRAAVQKDLVGSKPDLTAEEKQAAYDLIDQALTQGQAAINQAQDNTGVSQSYDYGAAAIAAIQGQAIAKPVAKAEIEKARQAKETAIDARTDLTAEEKTAAKAEAQREADTANTAIDNSANNAAVTAAQTDGQDTISAINPTAVAKPAAKAEVEKARQAKESAIDARTDLTVEEKAIAKAQAQEEAAAAKATIDSSAGNEDVAAVRTTSQATIEAINPTAVAKPAAKAEVEKARQAKETAIEGRTDLTTEEKATAKAGVQREADKANSAIDNSADNAAVSTVQTAGQDTISAINPTAVAKPAAKARIDAALAAKLATIDPRTDLTAEEKTAAKAEAQREADKAVAAIDAATDNTGVTVAQNKGTRAVQAISEQPRTKSKATADLSQKAVDQKVLVGANNALTTEEKQAAYALIDQALTRGQTVINQAQDNTGVSQSYNDGAAAVAAIQGQAIAKPAAKAEVEKARQAKETTIDARTDLTIEEKVAAKAEAQREAEAANTAIDNSADNAAVSTAQTAGQDTISVINPAAVVKSAAKAAIDRALQAKESTINAHTDLTAEEKAIAKAQAQEEAAAAKAAIDSSAGNEDVAAFRTTSQATIEAINPTAVAKPAAKARIDAALAAKLATIDVRTDLTTEEKATAKAEAQREAEAANTAIDNSVDNAAVTAAQTAGQDTISVINPAAVVKSASKADIDRALQAKESAIDARTDLTAEEKAAAKAQAQEEAAAAKAAIDSSAGNEDVAAVRTTSQATIEAINPAAVAKPAAKARIDAALAAKLAAIDARTDLTEAEKAAAKAEVEQFAAAAKAAIDEAADNASVAELEKISEYTIAAVDPQARVLAEAPTEQTPLSLASKPSSDRRLPKTASEGTVGLAVTGVFAALAGLSLTIFKREED